MNINKASLDKLDIVQRYFGQNDSGEIRNMFGDEYFSNMDDHAVCHYFIYINEPKPIVLFHLNGGNGLLERTNQFPELKEVLLKLPTINFHSLLFVLTSYYVFGKIDPIPLIEEGEKFEPLPSYDDLLSPTYGYVFYKHQLEQLISRISDDIHVDPCQMRKGWNKKSHVTFAEFDKLKVTDKLNLTEFLHQRTLEENHFVWSPNFRGTQLLWNYLLNQRN